MTKVLFVPSGGRLAPATRYRIYQYLPYLESAGIDYDVYSIISDATTEKMIRSPLFSGTGRVFYYVYVAFEKFIRGVRVALQAGRYDIIFLQRATFSFGLEKLLKWRNPNIIYDIDDSIYMPDSEEKGIFGWIKKLIKKSEVAAVLKVSKCVIVENQHIKSFVRKYCPNVFMITGPIDTARNKVKGYGSNPEQITIGWIGSPSTAVYLALVSEALKELGSRFKFQLKIIGLDHYFIDGVITKTVAWSEETEVEQLHTFDIGIMPMPDNEWTRGKVGCKMLQYMANGIPAVVSYTPTNTEVILDSQNGFIAGSKNEWVEKLAVLIENPEIRKGVGLNGRRTAEEKFSLTVNAPRFIEIINGLKPVKGGQGA